jgi:hypothetical protein
MTIIPLLKTPLLSFSKDLYGPQGSRCIYILMMSLTLLLPILFLADSIPVLRASFVDKMSDPPQYNLYALHCFLRIYNFQHLI